MFSKNKDAQISRFWEKYTEKTKRYNIRQEHVRWYVRHAELYIKAHDASLKTHTAVDLDTYLQDKGRNPGLKDWQFCQLVDALRILFVDVVSSPWADDYHWDDVKSQARSLSISHATIARVPITDVVYTDQANSEQSDISLGSIKEQLPDVFDAVTREIRARDYSIRTEQSYVSWLARFIQFHHLRHPKELKADAIASYLTYLAVNRMVASSTQRQALNAIIFYYKNILNKSFEDIGDFTLSKKPMRLPVVLSSKEVERLLHSIDDPVYCLMASLLYGCGMRLMECIRLRVFDIDFDYQQIMIRNAKGNKDRITPLPKKLVKTIAEQLDFVRKTHAEDLVNGLGEVYLPAALGRKYPNAAKEIGWQYLFPSHKVSVDPRNNKVRRHHIHENGLQRKIKTAASKAGVTKKVNCHALRHYKIHPCILPFRPAFSCSNLLQANLVICNSLTRSRLRYQNRSGVTRTCGCINDDDLYPCVK